MSERLHVRKINKIEYSSGKFPTVDGTYGEVSNILLGFGNNVWESEDENELQIPKEDFKTGVETIRSIPEEEFKKIYPKLAKVGYTAASVTEALQGFLDNADPDDENVSLDWF